MIAITVAGLLGMWNCTDGNVPVVHRIVVYAPHGQLRTWTAGKPQFVTKGSFKVDPGQRGPAETGTITEQFGDGQWRTTQLTVRASQNTLEVLGAVFWHEGRWVALPTDYKSICVRVRPRGR
jgi:hypothetical protein